MKILARPRQTGKTEALVAWLLADDKRIVLAPDEQRAMAIRSRAKLPAGSDRVRVAGRDYRSFEPWAVEYGVDDVDTLLYRLLHVMPSFVTMTAEPVGSCSADVMKELSDLHATIGRLFRERDEAREIALAAESGERAEVLRQRWAFTPED